MQQRTGVDVGFRKNGILYLCDSESEAAKQAGWLEQARPFQIDCRLIGSDEIARLLPGAARRWPAALYTPGDGCAEPQKATPAVANAAQRQGAHVLEHCAVRGIETAAGRVSGVITERGTIRCSQVVLAGGAWSGLFCSNLGIRLPLLFILNSVLRTAPLEGAPLPAAGGPDYAFRRCADGGYSIARRNANVADIIPDNFRYFFEFLPNLIKDWHALRLRFGRRFFEQLKVPRRWTPGSETPFERTRTLDPAPSESILDEGMRNLINVFPVFRQAKVVQRWAGLIDVTPDAVPVISAVPTLPGFFLSVGYSAHGFGIGPGAGQLTADLVMGRTPIVDPKPYRFERLSR
jgi:glycine/D-amino acid oxidase-like deaminating enzyme